jgi:hypothetical protein
MSTQTAAEVQDSGLETSGPESLAPRFISKAALNEEQKAALRAQKSTLFIEIFFNGVLPWLAYSYLNEYRHWSEYHSLLAVSIIPTAVGLYELWVRKRVDMMAVLSLGGILAGIALSAATSDPRLLQIRESYFTLAFGVLFLGSSMIGRPVSSSFIRSQLKNNPRGPEIARELETPGSRIRRLIHRTNWLWGWVFVAEFGVKLWMIQNLTIKQVLGWGPVVLGVMTALGLAVNLLLALRLKQKMTPVD